MNELAINEYVRLCGQADNLPRVSRPAHINPGVAWTTRESHAINEALLDLGKRLTREEMREALRRLGWTIK